MRRPRAGEDGLTGDGETPVARMPIQERDGWFVVQVPKAWLVLSKHELVRALRRGKWWRRRQAMAARTQERP